MQRNDLRKIGVAVGIVALVAVMSVSAVSGSPVTVETHESNNASTDMTNTMVTNHGEANATITYDAGTLGERELTVEPGKQILFPVANNGTVDVEYHG